MTQRFIHLVALSCMLVTPSVMCAKDSYSVLPEITKNSLSFQSDKNQLSIRIGGRIQADGALFFGSQYQPIGNGVGFRRARLYTDVSLGKRLAGKIEIDVADGGFSLKDCFIRYNFNQALYLRAGNFKEGFGMDALTSSGDLMFMEKANASSAFQPEFHLGIQATWQRKQFLGVAGVHFRAINGSKEKGYAEKNNKDGVNEGVSYTVRGVWMPLSANSEKGFHLGIAASYRTPKTSEEIAHATGYSTNSLSRISKMKFLDTGSIPSVGHEWLLGGEIGAYHKAFRLQGEYMLNRITRTNSLSAERFSGYYLQGAYLLFGGQQKYSTSRGAFSEPALGREWGDVELAARFDRIDLNGNDIRGGCANSWTLGATYYVTRNLKVQLNYSYVNHDRFANADGAAFIGVDAAGELTKNPNDVIHKGGNDYNIVALRIQLNF